VTFCSVALGLITKHAFGPLNPHTRCVDFGLPDHSQCFDIHADAVLPIDAIVVGVGEERSITPSADP
jgi:hypothetical protein